MKEAITPPISAKKRIDTVNKTDKSQAFNKTVAIIEQTIKGCQCYIIVHRRILEE